MISQNIQNAGEKAGTLFSIENFFELHNMFDANLKSHLFTKFLQILWLWKITPGNMKSLINGYQLCFWMLVIFKILQLLHFFPAKQVFNRDWVTCNSNRFLAEMIKSALYFEFRLILTQKWQPLRDTWKNCTDSVPSVRWWSTRNCPNKMISYSRNWTLSTQKLYPHHQKTPWYK